MNFIATLELGGKTATGITIPEEIVAALGAGRKPAVRATIGSHTYRSTIGVRGGEYKLPVSAENRARAGIEAGDDVVVRLELDTAPRSVEVPADLAAALADTPEAQRLFDTLTYSQQKFFVLPIEQAKKPETRAARIEKAVTMLAEGRKR